MKSVQWHAYRRLTAANGKELFRDAKLLVALVAPALLLVGAFVYFAVKQPPAPGAPVDLLTVAGVGVLYYALATLGLLGIAAPVAAMRSRGILRLLGTTPVSRLTLFAAGLTPRLVPSVVVIGLLVGWMGIRGEASPGAILAAGLVALAGFWVLCALGYLIGGQTASTEGAMMLANLLLYLLLLAGSTALPPGAFGWQRYAGWVNPMTYMADALRQLLGAGTAPVAPVWVDGPALVAWALGLTYLAARLFRWDQRER